MGITNGSPLAGANTLDQLNEILDCAREYPDATYHEIAELTGYRIDTIASVLSYYKV